MERIDYGLVWEPSAPDNALAGQLRIADRKSVILRLLEPPPDLWAGLPSGQGVNLASTRIPMLHALLADGGEASLLDCRWDGLSIAATQTQSLAARWLLVGAHLKSPDQKVARRVEVELPALGRLLGPQPLNVPATPPRRPKKLTLTVDDRFRSWTENSLTITTEYRYRMNLGSIDASVRMTPTLILQSSTMLSIETWIDTWLVPLIEAVLYLTGGRANPTTITAWPKTRPSAAERATTRMQILGRGIGADDSADEPGQPLVDITAFDRNPRGIHGVVDQLRALGASQTVFLELLRGVIQYADRPIRNRYLDLTACLEAYHSVSVGLGPIDPDAFKDSRKKALAAVKSAGVDASHHGFLKRWVLNRSSYSLENRLQQLAATAGTGGWTVSAQRMAAIRNDIAHGNAELNSTELRGAYGQAFDLARELLLRELGMVAAPLPTPPDI